ncbi:hypothetical protein PJP13_29805, partial [Mycobacterium kansasii]
LGKQISRTSKKDFREEIAQEIAKEIRQGRNACPAHLETKYSPFVEEVMQARLPERFRLPQITPFIGKTDPTEHIECFRT